MLLNEETLRFIFGLKLREVRQKKGLSLKGLSRLSKLSPSYLNEIEKGKKYPKTDKILTLAQSLGVSFESLISLELKEDLGFLSKLLEKDLLKGLPFEVLGIPARTLFEIMAERPHQFRTFVGTLLELARGYDVNVEDFFYATLRSLIDVRGNAFPELEAQSIALRKSIKGKSLGMAELIQALRARGVNLRFSQLEPDLAHLYYIRHEKTFLVNDLLSEREKVFVLAKELAHEDLGPIERVPTSELTNLDSFDKLYNNFRASYLASALLIPRDAFVKEVRSFLKGKTWDGPAFLRWAQSYPGTLESFMHRLSQILPQEFGLKELFLLRLNYHEDKKNFTLTKELRISEHHSPHAKHSTQHYCRRWISTNVLKALAPGQVTAACQTSNFFGTQNSYMCLTLAQGSELQSKDRTCITLGILLGDHAERLGFEKDPAIPTRNVAETCENCGIMDCEERAAAPTLFEERQRQERAQEALDRLLV